MDELHARNVIIGAGAVGSAAAYHLARRGEPFLLVEQFGLGHDRGSSHGSARIIRHSYDKPIYADLMPAAFAAWRELEADAGRPFYVRTGGVSLCPPGVDYVARVAGCLDALGVPHRRMTGRELRRALPAFGTPDDHDVVYEPDAGMLAAARAVAAQVELARERGGDDARVLEHTPIRRIDLDGTRPVLLGDGLRIVADRLIVAAGAWIGRLVPELASTLEVTRQAVLYLRPHDPAPYRVGRLPIFIYKGAGTLDAFYGMPGFLGTGVKAARHGGPPCDPDAVDRTVTDDDLAPVRRFLAGQLPGLASAPLASSEVCMYTVAPGDDFIVGPWPTRPDLLVASPCSGHGFKFSCLVGRILADYAVDGRTDLAVDAWRPGRTAATPAV